MKIEDVEFSLTPDELDQCHVIAMNMAEAILVGFVKDDKAQAAKVLEAIFQLLCETVAANKYLSLYTPTISLEQAEKYCNGRPYAIATRISNAL